MRKKKPVQLWTPVMDGGKLVGQIPQNRAARRAAASMKRHGVMKQVGEAREPLASRAAGTTPSGTKALGATTSSPADTSSPALPTEP